MRLIRVAARCWLLLAVLCALAPGFVAKESYETMFRDAPAQLPSPQHWLGTDEICRDRFSRLVYAARISLLAAPAAALLTTLLAGLVGAWSGYCGGRVDAVWMYSCELFLALPWLFVLIAARSALPLDTAPAVSASVTFGLLGLLGWPGPARIVRARVAGFVAGSPYLLARASGLSGRRIILAHLFPALRPVLRAQFLLAVPVFILSEANLSLIGLGVSEPLPSWGGMLRELERWDAVQSNPWLLAPLLLLILTIASFQPALSTRTNPQ